MHLTHGSSTTLGMLQRSQDLRGAPKPRAVPVERPAGARELAAMLQPRADQPLRARGVGVVRIERRVWRDDPLRRPVLVWWRGDNTLAARHLTFSGGMTAVSGDVKAARRAGAGAGEGEGRRS